LFAQIAPSPAGGGARFCCKPEGEGPAEIEQRHAWHHQGDESTEAWKFTRKQGRDGEGVVVAVLDTGYCTTRRFSRFTKNAGDPKVLVWTCSMRMIRATH
jgi:hypothetical protein